MLLDLTLKGKSLSFFLLAWGYQGKTERIMSLFNSSNCNIFLSLSYHRVYSVELNLHDGCF